jgi:serine phosphatase RsbU (regulator of sigma subunit)
MAASLNHDSLLELGVASCPAAGQTVSGDLHLVKPFSHGILIAVVDGVGHGDEATAAAQSAVAVLERNAPEPVISLVERCHFALTRTRGVVMTLASLHTTRHTLTWLGVGNVEGRLLRANRSASHPSESVLLRGGLVGYQLPALHASVIPVAPGDLLVFVTDGVAPQFDQHVNPAGSPQWIAQQILKQHFKGTDDALVLVARYTGNRHEPATA